MSDYIGADKGRPLLATVSPQSSTSALEEPEAAHDGVEVKETKATVGPTLDGGLIWEWKKLQL